VHEIKLKIAYKVEKQTHQCKFIADVFIEAVTFEPLNDFLDCPL
jgi:hypothetical protein